MGPIDMKDLLTEEGFIDDMINTYPFTHYST